MLMGELFDQLDLHIAADGAGPLIPAFLPHGLQLDVLPGAVAVGDSLLHQTAAAGVPVLGVVLLQNIILVDMVRVHRGQPLLLVMVALRAHPIHMALLGLGGPDVDSPGSVVMGPDRAVGLAAAGAPALLDMAGLALVLEVAVEMDDLDLGGAGFDAALGIGHHAVVASVGGAGVIRDVGAERGRLGADPVFFVLLQGLAVLVVPLEDQIILAAGIDPEGGVFFFAVVPEFVGREAAQIILGLADDIGGAVLGDLDAGRCDLFQHLAADPALDDGHAVFAAQNVRLVQDLGISGHVGRAVHRGAAVRALAPVGALVFGPGGAQALVEAGGMVAVLQALAVLEAVVVLEFVALHAKAVIAAH